MKKRLSKALATLLALAMILTVLPMNVQAEEIDVDTEQTALEVVDETEVTEDTKVSEETEEPKTEEVEAQKTTEITADAEEVAEDATYPFSVSTGTLSKEADVQGYTAAYKIVYEEGTTSITVTFDSSYEDGIMIMDMEDSNYSTVDADDNDDLVFTLSTSSSIYCAYDLSDNGYMYQISLVQKGTEKNTTDETFTAKAGDLTLPVIDKVENGYSYAGYGGTYTGTLYTVQVPEGTESVDLTFLYERLVYNYKSNGSEANVDENYLAGWVSDYTKGAKEVTVKTDANNDGEFDIIQVQNTYNADYTGGELIYAITFEEKDSTDQTFTAEVNGYTYPISSTVKDGYTYTDYNGVSTTVDLYKVMVPADATTVDLTFAYNRLAYNYDVDGETYLEGWYEDYIAGSKTKTVKIDSNADGVNDIIQVQNTYNSDYSDGALLYAIQFVSMDVADVNMTFSLGMAGFEAGGVYVKDDKTLVVAFTFHGNSTSAEPKIALLEQTAAEEEKEAAAIEGTKFAGTNGHSVAYVIELPKDLVNTAIPVTTYRAFVKSGSWEANPSKGTDQWYTWSNQPTLTISCNHSYADAYYSIDEMATCENTGVATVHCSFCGTSDETRSITLRALGHNYETEITPATATTDGRSVDVCTRCGEEKAGSEETIWHVANITLDKTSYVYSGKTIAPTVKVADSEGEQLTEGVDYDVTMPTAKAAGKYTVKITFKGNYTGTVSKTFTIVPKATSLKSVAAGSKRFTVKWAKQATQTTGYQIQYSTSSKFASGNKTVNVTKNATVSKVITGLKAKKTYYVRIRTYKKTSSGVVYSAWSAKKAVKTK